MAAPKVAKDKYMLQNDEEMGRLAQQHPVLKDAMGGSLIPPPIDLSGSGRRILDSGTADGLWLRDLQTTIGPNHEYIGTDINPVVFPKETPLNTSYAVQDINAPWPAAWVNSFDLVNQRLTLAGGGPAMRQVVANLANLVKPSGWIQLMEAEQIIASDDGPAMHQFIRLMADLFKSIGAGTSYAQTMGRWVEEAGFVDVQDKLFDVYLGAKNKDKKLGEQSAMSTAIAAKGLINFVKNMPPETTTVTTEEMETLAERLKAELLERGAYFPLRAVWGCKQAI